MKKRSRERQVEQTPKTQVAPEQAPTAPTAPTVEIKDYVETGVPHYNDGKGGRCSVCFEPMPCEKHAGPPKTCTICERPLPCPKHDTPVAALAGLEDGPQKSNALIENDDVPQPRTLAELHDRIVALRQPKPAYVPPPPTERQAERTRLEMEAGRRATERATAQQTARPATQPDRTQGVNTPVHRPADYDEYRGSFRSQGQTQSKDAR